MPENVTTFNTMQSDHVADGRPVREQFVVSLQIVTNLPSKYRGSHLCGTTLPELAQKGAIPCNHHVRHRDEGVTG